MPINWEVAAPCTKCNEGWMEDLETETQPILTPMLLDQEIALNPQAQRTLAQWATLRVMMAQHAHPTDNRSIPDESYARFYVSRALPAGAQVWIGRYSGAGAWPTNYQHTDLHASLAGRPPPSRPNGYLVAFSIGYVAFFYWGHEIENGPSRVNIGELLAPYLVPIWPATGNVRWPPKGLLGANDLGAIMRAFPIK
jgi:hypothetical protein